MTKAAPFVATTVPDITGKGPDDTISRKELVALVASIIPQDGQDRATLRKRISSMIATDRTILRPIERGRYHLGDVSDWTMRKKWKPELFGFLPKNTRTGTLVATLPPFRGGGSGHIDPSSLPEARSQINALIQENLALKQALTLAEDQLSRDAPLAQQKRNESFAKTKEGRRLKDK